MVVAAQRDAEKTHADLMARAHAEAERLARQAQHEIQLTKESALTELWSTAAKLSAAIAEKALRAQLSAKDHALLIEDAVRDLSRAEGSAA